MTKGRVPMTYNPVFERLCVEMDGRQYGLHCAGSLRLHLGNKALDCRLELGGTWDVVAEDVTISLRDNQRYLVGLQLLEDNDMPVVHFFRNNDYTEHHVRQLVDR